MSAPAAPRLSDAFNKDVRVFHTDHFSLREDLDWLGRQRALQSPVGVIIHSSRILEVLALDALTRSRLSPLNGKLHDVLRQLNNNHYLSRDAHTLLERLRDLGNQARHVLSKVTFDAAEQGFAILLRGLQWYFCEFPRGPRLGAVCVANQSLDELMPAGPAALLRMLDAAILNPRGFLDALRLDLHDCPVLASPVLAAVVAERLLNGKADDQAQVVLTAALVRFPDDVRLRQLQGLLWSRAGRLEVACTWLETIDTPDSAADEETQGILAGAWKRRADAEPGRRQEWLEKCYEGYERGWRQSQEVNTYLGINAAATALWLGLTDKTATIAASIRKLLEERRRCLAKTDGEPPQGLNCWDLLTLAEAYLLLEEWQAARRHYREAVERFSHLSGTLAVARDQAKQDLEAMGRSDLIGDVFPE